MHANAALTPRARLKLGRLVVIDKVTVTLNERRDVYEALLANLGVKGVEVPNTVVKRFEKLLVGGICFGLAIGTKWTALYPLAALAIFLGGYPQAIHGSINASARRAPPPSAARRQQHDHAGRERGRAQSRQLVGDGYQPLDDVCPAARHAEPARQPHPLVDHPRLVAIGKLHPRLPASRLQSGRQGRVRGGTPRADAAAAGLTARQHHALARDAACRSRRLPDGRFCLPPV